MTLPNETLPADIIAAAPAEGRPKKKRQKRDVHGWIVLDKPVGMTSTHAVAVIKHLFGAKRAGHAGTLDPLASDCLPIALGEATKTVPFVVDSRKDLSVSPSAGARSATPTTPKAGSWRPAKSGPMPRRSGRCCRASPAPSSRFRRAIQRSKSTANGPMTSRAAAKPSNWRPGRSKCTGSNWSIMPDPDHAVLAAECGKGTYVRSLARDLGRALGALGHVSALRRNRVGPFGEGDMIPLEQVEALCHRAAAGEGHLADTLLPIETALDDIPALAVSPADAARLQRGQAVLLRGRDASIVRGIVQVASGGQFVAIAEAERGEIVPRRVFNLSGIAGRAGRKG